MKKCTIPLSAYGSAGSIMLSTPIPRRARNHFQVTFKIEDSKKRYLERLINLIGEDYETPIAMTNNVAARFDGEKEDTRDSDDFDLQDEDVMSRFLLVTKKKVLREE